MEQKILNHISPNLNQLNVYHFNQIRNYIDVSIKNFNANDFENDKEKIKHLFDSLQDLRDFVVGQLLENNLRQSLVNEILEIEKEIEVGNSLQEVKEN